ncbi:MAG: LamG domain-containing protein [Candidatus Heimdallarchaeota archaeon]
MANWNILPLKNQKSTSNLPRILQKTIISSVTALLILGMVLPFVLITTSTESANMSYRDNSWETERSLPVNDVKKNPTILSPAATDDWLEDNDNIALAKSVTIGNQTASLRASGNDPDFYNITPSAGYFLMIEIQYDASETDFDIRVYNAGETVVALGNASGSTDAVRLDLSTASSTHYYAEVFVANETILDPQYNASQLYTYDLFVFLEDRFGKNFYQSNNDTLNAVDLPTTTNPTDFHENVTVSSLIRPNDTYRFLLWETNEVNITVEGALTSGGPIFTELSGIASEGLFTMILDPTGTEITSYRKFWDSSNQTTVDSVVFTAGSSGYYYLKLWFNYTNPSQAMVHLTLDVDDSTDGINHSGSSFATAPTIRGGINFEGEDDYISIPDAPNLRLGQTMTIEAWLKISSYPSDWARIIGKGDNTRRNYGLWLKSDGHILWQIFSPGGSIDLESNSICQIGTWYYVAASYNSTHLKIYIDGTLDKSAAYPQVPYTSDDPVTIGYSGYHHYYEGLLDEVRILNVALTDSEISADASSVPTLPIRAGTVAWYLLEGNNDTTISDNSGSGNTGTIYGGARRASSEILEGFWASANYPDYFRVILKKDDILDVSVNFFHALGDLNLYLFNSSGMTNLFAASTSELDEERISAFRSPQAAEYYLFLNSTIPGQRYYNSTFQIHFDDLYEENDYFLDPAPLKARNSTYNLFLEKTESDFFSLELGYQDLLNVTITFNGSIGNLDLAIYDRISGNVLGSSSHSSGSHEIVTWLSPIESSIIIRIYAPMDGGITEVGVEYQLLIAIRPTDDRYEDNDDLDSAFLIGEASISDLIVRNNDPDYYMVYLLNDEPLRVDLTYIHADGNIDLWILDDGGTPISKGETVTDNESISTTASSDGVHYVYVHLSNGTVNFYNITISYTEKEDSFEDNDSPEQATIITSGAYQDIHLRWGDPDFYNITIPAIVEFVNITAEFNRSLGNLIMELYMPNGTIFSVGETLSNTTEGIDLRTATIPFFGEYYLRLWLNNTEAVTPLVHDMTLALTEAAELNTTIRSIPFPEPSREFLFLSSSDLDPALIVTMFIGGMGSGAIVIILLRRRFGT